ncbi:hypothetical protein ES5_11206 [Dietzia cinnamea P4]|nr:hypothetical protein ES5_11206 [Dietzia cinnamea P4]
MAVTAAYTTVVVRTGRTREAAEYTAPRWKHSSATPLTAVRTATIARFPTVAWARSASTGSRSGSMRATTRAPRQNTTASAAAVSTEDSTGRRGRYGSQPTRIGPEANAPVSHTAARSAVAG